MKTVKSLFVATAALWLTAPAAARAHCDTLDGPVIQTARTSLESGKVAPVLAWVQAKDEAEIRHAFDHARAVRKLGPEAKSLADRFFFETLVRVHRAGEGAPYTGLKPAGQDLGPAVAAADKSIETGSPAEVEKLLVESVRHGLHQRFEALASQKKPGDDVARGRAWVQAYVPYVHWVEGVHTAAGGAGHHGEAEAKAEPAPGHAH
ncbi:MAG TPA: DUF6448 family protein [Anaeromyxobacteraceae bacterium]|nr:DUF6448 family protein [Anaeromyxobacteraceae bacterium]